MRHWIRLCEASAVTIRVFHGSPEQKLHFTAEPLYGVRDFGFAASYGLERTHIGRGKREGFVHTLDFHFTNLCDQDTLYKLFEQHNIEPWPSAAGVFIDNPEFLDILRDAGYDGLTAWDFGFRTDFEELPVWMVVDAAKQVTWRGVVTVTDDDLPHSHEPET